MHLHIKELYKQFADHSALCGIDLHVRSGEFLVFLGPSGSGKTTLLRVIAGLEFSFCGQVLFGTQDASLKRVQDRNIGFVFQHFSLFKHMTVFGNIAFGFKVNKKFKKYSKEDIKARVLELLELVQLEGMGDRYPSQLSGGQRQRVALARALAIEPKILLLDEPFGSLDPTVRKQLRLWLRKIHDATKLTTIFVTHDQQEALELADRIVIMNKGRIEQVGTPDEVYNKPVNGFVFQFIGESNVLPVEINDGKAYFEEFAFALNDDSILEGSANLYIRPHDIEITTKKDFLPALVSSVRLSGGTYSIEAKIGKQQRVIEITTSSRQHFKVNQKIHLNLHRYHLFRNTNKPPY